MATATKVAAATPASFTMACSLPISLLALALFSIPRHATAQQVQTTLQLNTIFPQTISSDATPSASFSLPPAPTNAPLSVSVALCSDTQPFPKFSVINDSSAGNTWQLSLDEGIGVWNGGTAHGSQLVVSFDNGAVRSTGLVWSFEVAVSSGGPLHRTLSTLPLLGDTTATQALLFSPPFAPPVLVTPSYPNYTLPGGNLSLPDQPPASAQSNSTLIFVPTSPLRQQASLELSSSACAIKNAASSISGSWIGTNGTGGVNGSTGLFLRDEEGWRSQWLIEGLRANTNYSAWIVEDGGGLGGPIFASTKSSSFDCPLAHSLPFCPLVSYAVPLPPTPDGTTSYTSSNLPSNISDPLISSLSNFTTSLLTFPCGREAFSPILTCESCANAYRAWACAVSLPRCGEIPSSLASTLAAQPTSSKGPPLPTPALISHPSAVARLQENGPYDELLPCIETCYAVDRSCPPLFGWTCPHPTVNANFSYGVGFIDGFDGSEGKGVPGVAQDRWGVAWCNG
ncbi:hypothetical protein K439DRAFT_1638739 [Ramaria rubella]|nr:hypothetical protein K439DRAFT_1638739 [Ramaria rubella]